MQLAFMIIFLFGVCWIVAITLTTVLAASQKALFVTLKGLFGPRCPSCRGGTLKRDRSASGQVEAAPSYVCSHCQARFARSVGRKWTRLTPGSSSEPNNSAVSRQ